MPLILLASYFAAVLVGGFLGFIVADIRLVATLFDHDGMKHLPILKWGSSKRKIKNTMLRYDKNFSFDKFEGQLVSLVRMAVLAEKPEELACYRADAREPLFSDILEMTYTNGICLNGIRMEGNIMHMSVRTWWVNHYEEHGKVKKSGDCIACRNHRAELCHGFAEIPRQRTARRTLSRAECRQGRTARLLYRSYSTPF